MNEGLVTRDSGYNQMISSRFLKNKAENITDIRNEWSLETNMLIMDFRLRY